MLQIENAQGFAQLEGGIPPKLCLKKIANILPNGCEHKGLCVETYRKKENENG